LPPDAKPKGTFVTILIEDLFINVVALAFLRKVEMSRCLCIHIYINMNRIMNCAGEIILGCEIM